MRPYAAGVEIIQEDFLKVDLDRILSSEGSGGAHSGAPLPGRWRCVANLPYSITGPAVLRLLASAAWFDRMVVMVQQEVAERLLAPPGGRARGLLTVLAEARCVISTAGAVSRRCFFPQPKVDSTILVFEPRHPSLVPAHAQEAFESMVKAAFSTRRKMLSNALAHRPGLGLSKEAAAALVSQSGIDPNRRAESLSAQEFLSIANRFIEMKATTEPQS